MQEYKKTDSSQGSQKIDFGPDYPDLDKQFKEAITSLLNLPWQKVHIANNWYEVLPAPPVAPTPTGLMLAIWGPKEWNEIGAIERDRYNYWARKAEVWFQERKRIVNYQRGYAIKKIAERLQALGSPYNRLLSANKATAAWFAQHKDKTLCTFSEMEITVDGIDDHLAPMIRLMRNKYGVEELSVNSVSEEPNQFTTELRNYTVKELDELLVHMNMKGVGNAIQKKFPKYMIHSVIDALDKTKHLDKTGQQTALYGWLAKYLNVEVTRIKSGWGKREKQAKEKAVQFINLRKKEQK